MRPARLGPTCASASRLITASAIVCACASPAGAQTPRVAGPFAGLFGGSSDGRNTQSLDVRGSVFGVYQEVLEPSADLLRELDPRFQQSGTFGGASGSASYTFQRSTRRAAFFVAANASAADYSVQPETIMATYNASTGLSAQFTRKISFNTSAYGAYAPFYNFGSGAAPVTGADLINLAPGSIPTGAASSFGGGGIGFDQTLPGSEFGFNSLFEPNVTFGASAGINATLNQRTSLAVAGDYRDQRLTQSRDVGYGTFSGSATFRRNITKRLVFRLGYRREISTYGDATAKRFSRDGYEIGLDYGDSLTLPLGRRTTLSLAPAATAVRYDDQTQFRLNGNVTLTRGIGRSWSASTGYRRDLEYVLGFDQPILTDNVFANVGGTLLRRLRWTSSAGWMRGKIGFDKNADQFSWYYGSSGLSMALLRHLALYTQYNYYSYTVPSGSTALSLLGKFSRQSVTAGLSVFAPVFRTGRVRP